MNHRHLESEEIFEQISEGRASEGIEGCATCGAEAASLSRFLVELKAADAASLPNSDWDDLLLRRRIREALAEERPHARSIFDRFPVLRPAFATALVASLAFSVWAPLSRYLDVEEPGLASTNSVALGDVRLPAWTPLPDEAEDEGLAVLAEWTPTEDELTIARCRAACLAGLSSHEEERLLNAVAMNSANAPLPLPITGASPL